jgi:hypothetical protein
MRTKLKALPEVILDRTLEALGQELIDASDKEILEAAKDLGMNPNMKGSAAFLGLTFPARMTVSDLFEFEGTEESILQKASVRTVPGFSGEPGAEDPGSISKASADDSKETSQE